MAYVLSSLTANHLKILQLLTKETSGSSEGITFSNFHELCLCEMIVSSEKSLQLIMKELEDHDLPSGSHKPINIGEAAFLSLGFFYL